MPTTTVTKAAKRTGIKCEARIRREYKTRKADAAWLESGDGLEQFPEHKLLPVCGGEVTVTLRVENEPDYHSDHYAVLMVELTCSRCDIPWIPERKLLEAAARDGTLDLTPFIAAMRRKAR